MTEAEAVELVALLTAAFPTPAWAEETIRLYASMLDDLDLGAARYVVVELIRSRVSDRPPTIGEIRQRVAQRQAEDADVRLLAPEDAWGFVQRMITRIGHTGEFPDTHPLVKRIVDRLGWPNLCLSTNQVADRARFLELYRELIERTLRDAAGSTGAVPRIPVDRLAEPLRAVAAIDAAPMERPDVRHDVAALLAETRARIESRVGSGAKPASAEVTKEEAVSSDQGVLARRLTTRTRLREQAATLLGPRNGGRDTAKPGWDRE